MRVPELPLRRRLTAPPSASRHELHAVADAERRHAELEHAGIAPAARQGPTRFSARPTG